MAVDEGQELFGTVLLQFAAFTWCCAVVVVVVSQIALAISLAVMVEN